MTTNQTPIIVTLCGSTKFKKEFEEAYHRETMKGKIVLTVGCFTHADALGTTEKQKEMLDELHFRKIDISSEILVVNVGGYIGESTRNEIDYAYLKGKSVCYLE
jgi:hypothetical protein